MNMKQPPRHFILTEQYAACERGNIWLTHTEEDYHNAWFRLEGDFWLQVSIRPCNYPGFEVNTVAISDRRLAAHIRKQFGNGVWRAMKMNLDGVALDGDGLVIGEEG